MLHTLFFELLQVAIGNRNELSRTPTAEEWEELYDISKKQTMHGIAFAALERLPQEQLPPPRRIRQWAVKIDRLRENNIKASKLTAAIWRYFEDNGFHCVILKGQGNMANYPEHLKNLRSPGDIDVWAWPRRSSKLKTQNSSLITHNSKLGNHDVRDVVEFCQSKKKGAFMYYHNLDFPILKEIPVEVHYRPTWLYTPWRNSRLQKWFRDYKHNGTIVDYDGYKIPSNEFNLTFQLLHLYKHIFEEGIGLRQLLDYYMVLTHPIHPCKGDDCQQDSSTSLIGSAELSLFGLTHFAGAVMYVLREVFNADASLLPWQVDEKRGKQLLSEIMLSGNFGQHDERYHWGDVTNGSLKYRGLPYAMARLRHNIHFLISYPSEVLFEPLFRIYNKLWLKLRLWRFE